MKIKHPNKKQIRSKIKQKQQKVIDFREDSKQNTGQSQLLDLEAISQQVIMLQAKLSLLDAAEMRVAQLKQEISKLKIEDIPALMDQFNLSEVKLKDGSKIHIRPLIQASLPSEGAILKCRNGEQRSEMRQRLTAGFTFLRKNGAASLIKTLLKVDFGKDSEDKAAKAIAALKKIGVAADVTKGVHPQSLNAWVRERLEDGKPVDMETFKVFSGQIAEITTPNLERII